MALKLLTLCQCLALAMAVAPLRLSGMADAGPAAAGGALGDAIKPATPVWPERFGVSKGGLEQQFKDWCSNPCVIGATVKIPPANCMSVTTPSCSMSVGFS